MTVHFNNNGAFECQFSVQWDGGETSRSSMVGMGNPNGGTDISMPGNGNPPDGTSCFARAYIVDGPNHDSRDAFIYHADAATVTYSVSGTTYTSSFDCDGCQ